ncbi:FkbM family methyltransferase [Humitalea rosea]|uniref:FkbM family methyltransferase n=1 Tax=Humitalea rosea TaxID=990373 RepID=A0A2W7HZH1_9PROT|nr:FkbM family methyltransferase [Humitalea rosea]PZW37861.1 FkbM family methyltransferase [Humitalea rosea]
MRRDTADARVRAYRELLATITPAQAGEMYELLTTDLYTAALKPGDTALDGGANVGRHAIPMAQAVGPAGRVHAFEPSPAVLHILKNRLEQAEVAARVTVHEVALGAVDGTAMFSVFHGATGMSGLQRRDMDEALKAKVEIEDITVPIRPLDHIFPDTTAVRFIKLDLEGGEYHAMLGGRALIRRQRPLMVFENGRGHSAKDYNYTQEEFFDLFRALGYDLFDALGFPFTPGQWSMGSVPWQYIAIPEEAAAERAEVFGVIAARLRANGLRATDE